MKDDTKELSKDTLTDFGAIHQSIDDDLKGPFTDITETVWPLVVETWEEHLKPTFQDASRLYNPRYPPHAIEELKQIWNEVWWGH